MCPLSLTVLQRMQLRTEAVGASPTCVRVRHGQRWSLSLYQGSPNGDSCRFAAGGAYRRCRPRPAAADSLAHALTSTSIARDGYNKFTGQVVRAACSFPGSSAAVGGNDLTRPTSQQADRDVECAGRTAQ